MYDSPHRSDFDLRQTVNKFILVVVITLFFALRLVGLGRDITNSDGPRWHRRSEKFLAALKTQDYVATYQRYQPGVTLMWINSGVKQLGFWYQFLYTNNPKTLENADWYPIIHGLSKSVTLFVLGGLLLCQMHFIRKIFSSKIALIYGFFISIEPYLLGVDRWFHLTSLEVYFGFAAFLSLLSWLKFGASVMEGPFKDWVKNNKYLFISAALFSLSVLSKLTSLILVPLFLTVFVAAFWVRFSILGRCDDGTIDFKYLLRDIGKYIVFFVLPFFGISLAVFFILFPALWVSPSTVFIKFYNALVGAVGDDVRSLQIANINPYIYYPLVLLFKLSPITLFLLLLSVVFVKKVVRLPYSNYVYLYVIVYYVFLTLADKKIDRYTLVLLPGILLLIAVFISSFGKRLLGGFLVVSLFFTLWLVVRYYPVYSSYYSPIFGGTMGALKVGIYENSGEYFSQAAAYLNEKGRDIYTYVPNGVESFSYYYKGKLQREFDEKTNFIVTSFDIDRKDPAPKECPKLDRGFGPRDSNLPNAGRQQGVVFVYECR